MALSFGGVNFLFRFPHHGLQGFHPELVVASAHDPREVSGLDELPRHRRGYVRHAGQVRHLRPGVDVTGELVALTLRAFVGAAESNLLLTFSHRRTERVSGGRVVRV